MTKRNWIGPDAAAMNRLLCLRDGGLVGLA